MDCMKITLSQPHQGLLDADSLSAGAAGATKASSSTDEQPLTQKTTERMNAVGWSLANPSDPRTQCQGVVGSAQRMTGTIPLHPKGLSLPFLKAARISDNTRGRGCMLTT